MAPCMWVRLAVHWREGIGYIPAHMHTTHWIVLPLPSGTMLNWELIEIGFEIQGSAAESFIGNNSCKIMDNGFAAWCFHTGSVFHLIFWSLFYFFLPSWFSAFHPLQSPSEFCSLPSLYFFPSWFLFCSSMWEHRASRLIFNINICKPSSALSFHHWLKFSVWNSSLDAWGVSVWSGEHAGKADRAALVTSPWEKSKAVVPLVCLTLTLMGSWAGWW